MRLQPRRQQAPAAPVMPPTTAPESGRFWGSAVRKGIPEGEFNDHKSGLPPPFKSVVACGPPRNLPLSQLVDDDALAGFDRHGQRCQAGGLLAPLLPAFGGRGETELGHHLAGTIDDDDVMLLLRPVKTGEVGGGGLEGHGGVPVGGRGRFGAAAAGAPVRGRADTGSSRDGVLSDLGTEAFPPAGNLLEALVERPLGDRAGREAKLPVAFWHAAKLFTSPLGLAAKLCAIAAAEDGFGEAFLRRSRITVETVSVA